MDLTALNSALVALSPSTTGLQVSSTTLFNADDALSDSESEVNFESSISTLFPLLWVTCGRRGGIVVEVKKQTRFKLFDIYVTAYKNSFRLCTYYLQLFLTYEHLKNDREE